MNVRTALRPAAASLLVLALVACAGQSGPNKPQTEYMYSTDVALQAGQFVSGTRLLPYFIGEVSQDGTASSTWHTASFPVSATGTGRIELDARDIPDELTARDLINYWHKSLQAEDSVSDETVRLRVIMGVALMQPSSSNESSMYSHLMSPLHQYVPIDRQVRAPTQLVFADGPVSIQATRTSMEPAYTSAMDIDLAAGWNLVYREAVMGSDSLHARPLTETDRLVALAPEAWTAANTTLDTDVIGWSLIPSHLRNQADGEVPNFGAGNHDGSPVVIFGNKWITTEDSRLTSASEALGMGDVTFDPSPPANLQLATGTLLGYDDRTGENWWRKPGLSSGDIELRAPDGNRVLPVYASEAATLHFTGSWLDDPVSTIDTGLTLDYGWNHVLMSRDETDAITLSIYADTIDGISLHLLPR